jgi:hypothetical protein
MNQAKCVILIPFTRTINLYGFSFLLMLPYKKFELSTSAGSWKMYLEFL